MLTMVLVGSLEGVKEKKQLFDFSLYLKLHDVPDQAQ